MSRSHYLPVGYEVLQSFGPRCVALQLRFLRFLTPYATQYVGIKAIFSPSNFCIPKVFFVVFVFA